MRGPGHDYTLMQLGQGNELDAASLIMKQNSLTICLHLKQCPSGSEGLTSLEKQMKIL